MNYPLIIIICIVLYFLLTNNKIKKEKFANECSQRIINDGYSDYIFGRELTEKTLQKI